MATGQSAGGISVLKLGSSVLGGAADLPLGVAEVARHRRHGRDVVAVVSAFRGATGALLAGATAVSATPAAAPLAALLATGEATAAALLALALERAGVPAALFDVRRAGLRARGARLDADPVALDRGAFGWAFARGLAVVLPGFAAVAADGGPALLGRGGSDLTALFVADRLGAASCRLLKDTGGVFESDPARDPAARRYHTLCWDDAARLGGRVIQAKALRFALARRRAFEVAAPGGGAGTRVGPNPTRLAAALPRAQRPRAISSTASTRREISSTVV